LTAASALLTVAGALEDGLEVGAVVAHRPVPAIGARERVLVEVGAGEPRQVLADFRGIGPAGLSGERSARKSVDVVREHGAELVGQLQRSAAATTPPDGDRVL
jgi:hypothetical protein